MFLEGAQCYVTLAPCESYC